MQQPHAHTDARAARPAASRLAWLGLGLFTAAFAVFEVVKHGPGAVPFYNAAHRVWGPLALLVACTFWIDSAALFTGALAWLAHVAVDRAAGFGLRTAEGFQHG